MAIILFGERITDNPRRRSAGQMATGTRSSTMPTTMFGDFTSAKPQPDLARAAAYTLQRFRSRPRSCWRFALSSAVGRFAVASEHLARREPQQFLRQRT